MKSTLNPAFLTARVLLFTISSLTSTFYVTQTWSDSIFFNCLMKVQGFFGFLCFSYLSFNSKIAYCDSSTSPVLISPQDTFLLESCVVEGIINLHYDAITFLFMILFLVIVIMGYSLYFFDKKRFNPLHYPQFYVIENFLKDNPTTPQKFRTAGYTIISGLSLMVLAGLVYLICPSQASSLVSAMETPVVAEVGLIQNEILSKAVTPLQPYPYKAIQQHLDSLYKRSSTGKFYYHNSDYVNNLNYINSLEQGGESVGIRGGTKRHAALVQDVNTFMTKLSASPRDLRFFYKLTGACYSHGRYEELYLTNLYVTNNTNVNMIVFEVFNSEFVNEPSYQPVTLQNSNPYLWTKGYHRQVELEVFKYCWKFMYGLDTPNVIIPKAFIEQLQSKR